MSTRLFEPWGVFGRAWGLPDTAGIAVPSTGERLFRLVTNNPPTADDFRPISSSLASRRGIPELLRLGLSHFVAANQAATWRWKEDQRIAQVTIPADPRIFLALTDRNRPGHVEVWCPKDLLNDLVDSAEIVE